LDRARRGVVLRAVDKLDPARVAGVARCSARPQDESGDFTKGAELSPAAVARVLAFVARQGRSSQEAVLASLADTVSVAPSGKPVLLQTFAKSSDPERRDYGPERVRVDSAIVRGLRLLHRARLRSAAHLPATNETARLSSSARWARRTL